MQQPLMQDNMRDHWLLRGRCELLRPRLLTKLRICGILVFSYAIKRQCTVGLLHYDFASFIFFFLFNFLRFSLSWRRGGPMVIAFDSGSSGPGSSPGRGHCVVFLGKTLYSHSASLHPGVQMGTRKCAGGNPVMD